MAVHICPNCGAVLPEGAPRCPACKCGLTWPEGRPDLALEFRPHSMLYMLLSAAVLLALVLWIMR